MCTTVAKKFLSFWDALSSLLLLLTSSEQCCSGAAASGALGGCDKICPLALLQIYIFLRNDRVYSIRGIPVRNNVIHKHMTEWTSDMRVTKARTVSNVSATVWVLLYALTSFHTSGLVWYSGGPVLSVLSASSTLQV